MKGGRFMEKETSVVRLEAIVDAPIDIVWDCFSKPWHITKWNYASDDWHSPFAQNDLYVGGKFNYRMEEKNGTIGFDFTGSYDAINDQEFIAYTLDDGRKVEIFFYPIGNDTKIIQTFETEHTFPREMQEQGWNSILQNFKLYVESIK